MTLRFFNPGEIDPRTIATLGVNVKDSASAIGFFGTGLKYALATLLRTGHRVTIWSGITPYRFTSRTETIRGKEFSLIYMNETQLGFTTDLGKNWAVWQALRELICNAWDEAGDFSGLPLVPKLGMTLVEVDGAEAAREWDSRRDWLLPKNSQPFAVSMDASVEFFPKRGNGIFYRGVRVLECPMPIRYTYNILSPISLTEDRTTSPWTASYIIATAVLALDDPEILTDILTAEKGSFESQLDFMQLFEPSQAFLNTAEDLWRNKLTYLNQTALRALYKYRPHLIKRETLVATEIQKEMLNRALHFLSDIGCNVTAPIEISNLDDRTSGMAQAGTIYLDPKNFSHGTKFLAATLYEEHLHISLGFPDFSRAMQEALLTKIMDLGEMLRGQPL